MKCIVAVVGLVFGAPSARGMVTVAVSSAAKLCIEGYLANKFADIDSGTVDFLASFDDSGEQKIKEKINNFLEKFDYSFGVESLKEGRDSFTTSSNGSQLFLNVLKALTYKGALDPRLIPFALSAHLPAVIVTRGFYELLYLVGLDTEDEAGWLSSKKESLPLLEGFAVLKYFTKNPLNEERTDVKILYAFFYLPAFLLISYLLKKGVWPLDKLSKSKVLRKITEFTQRAWLFPISSETGCSKK